MLTLEPFSEDQGRSVVHPRGILPISFLTPYGFTHPLTRTHVRLLGPCFKTGRMGSPQADALSTQMPWHAVRRVLHTTIKAATSPRATLDSLFKVLFIFTRGTCSPSVSRPYLALEGIYRPIGAAFPNNPTRRQRLVVRQGPGTTGLSPSLAPLSRDLGPGPSLRTLLQTTPTPKTSDFQAGLFPVRSPLLRESLTLGHQELSDRTTDDITRLEFTTACRDAPGALSSDFGQPRAVTHGDQLPSHILERMGTTICDTQADVPRQKAWGATCAQRLDGSRILQFTPSIAFRHALHRCEPRYPLPRVVLDFTLQHYFRTNTASGWRKQTV
ncbi:hypothetical protein Bca101_068648 [Brassica carinata]